MKRLWIRGARALLFKGSTWELHVRVFGDGRQGRRAMLALAGLNGLAAGVAAGATLPAPSARALAGGLACHALFRR